jgi:hypothetical protein
MRVLIPFVVALIFLSWGTNALLLEKCEAVYILSSMFYGDALRVAVRASLCLHASLN